MCVRSDHVRACRSIIRERETENDYPGRFPSLHDVARMLTAVSRIPKVVIRQTGRAVSALLNTGVHIAGTS